jgi:hypothetical protein
MNAQECRLNSCAVSWPETSSKLAGNGADAIVRGRLDSETPDVLHHLVDSRVGPQVGAPCRGATTSRRHKVEPVPRAMMLGRIAKLSLAAEKRRRAGRRRYHAGAAGHRESSRVRDDCQRYRGVSGTRRSGRHNRCRDHDQGAHACNTGLRRGGRYSGVAIRRCGGGTKTRQRHSHGGAQRFDDGTGACGRIAASGRD